MNIKMKNLKIKILTNLFLFFSLLISILLAFLVVTSQSPALATSEQIKSLFQQRHEFIEEQFRLVRLRWEAGVGTPTEILLVELKLLALRLEEIEVFEAKNLKQARIKVLEKALQIALQVERNVEIEKSLPLVMWPRTTYDVLYIKDRRLGIQVQLELEK